MTRHNWTRSDIASFFYLPFDGLVYPRIALLYDHSKHLLSLSLLGIGGIMTLTQSSVGERIESIITAMLIMLFAGSGLCSLSVAAAILRAAKSNELPGRSAWMLNQGAMGLLGAGVAVFLISWIRVII